MKMFLENLYLEALNFAGQFTFGFELEAWYPEDYGSFEPVKDGIYQRIENFDIVKGSLHFKKDSSINPYGHIECPACDGTGEIYDSEDETNYECFDCEGTGRISEEYYGDDYAFEMTSPILKFSPLNISKTLDLLNYIMEEGVETNETCGFHIHLGFPIQDDKSKAIEMFWCLCQLVNDDNMFQKVKNHKGTELYEDEYASLSVLNRIQVVLNQEGSNFSVLRNLSRLYNSDKYIAFRQHPQGTLEWRGPRGFLKNKQFHKSFFIEVLYKLVVFFTDAIDMNKLKIKSGYISKQDFITFFKNKLPPLKYNQKFLMNSEDIRNAFKYYNTQLSKINFNNASIINIGEDKKLTFDSVDLISGELSNALIIKTYNLSGMSFNFVAFENIQGGSNNCYFNDCFIDFINKFEKCFVYNTHVGRTNQIFQATLKDCIFTTANNILESKISKSNIKNFSIIIDTNFIDCDLETVSYYGRVGESKFQNCNMISEYKNESGKYRINNSQISDSKIKNFGLFKSVIKNSTLIDCYISPDSKVENCINERGEDISNV